MDDPFEVEKMGGGNSSPPQHKPKIGRGAYLNAPGKPHWHQNLHNPRFVANAMVNNPSVAVSTAGGVAAAGALSQRHNMTNKGKKRTDEGSAAALGAGAGAAHSHRKAFKVKAWTQDPKNNDDWQKPGSNNPEPGPHKKAILDLQRDSREAAKHVGGSKRVYQEHYNAHFPEGLKSAKARRWLATKHGKYTGAAMAVGVGAGVAAAAGAHKAKEEYGKRSVDQHEINQRKKVSAVLTRSSSATGLLAAGTLVAGHGAPKLVGTQAGKLMRVTDAGAKAFKAKTAEKAGVITIGSGGVAGMNGFNNATIQSAEAKQRKRNAVKKPESLAKSASAFENEGIFGEVSKYYDPEANRKKRADAYEAGAAAASGAALAGAGHQAAQANKHWKKAKTTWNGPNPSKKITFDRDAYNATRKARGRAGVLAAVGVGAAVGAKKIHDKKDNSWQPYAKSLGGMTPGMGAMRPAPSAAKFKPLGQRPVSANVKNMRKVPLANGGPSGGGPSGVGNSAGLSGVGKSADFGVFND